MDWSIELISIEWIVLKGIRSGLRNYHYHNHGWVKQSWCLSYDIYKYYTISFSNMIKYNLSKAIKAKSKLLNNQMLLNETEIETCQRAFADMDQEDNGLIRTADLRMALERIGCILSDNEIFKIISDVVYSISTMIQIRASSNSMTTWTFTLNSR